MTDEQTAGANQRDQQMGQLSIQKIYVKDLSFEAPNTPGIFTEQLNPSVDVHFENSTNALGEDNHEVVLTVTVTVKQDDHKGWLSAVVACAGKLRDVIRAGAATTP